MLRSRILKVTWTMTLPNSDHDIRDWVLDMTVGHSSQVKPLESQEVIRFIGQLP